jgi:phenylacetate-CoA ligase
MNILKNFTKSITFPLADAVFSYHFTDKYHKLLESDFWSRSKLIDYQNEKLVQLIEHAYRHVPFYKELFKKNKLQPGDIQSRADLYKIPILTKEDIIHNFEKLQADNVKKNILYKTSSGSTGQTTRYYITKEAYSISIASYLRGWNWMGYELGDKVIKVSQNKRTSNFKKLQDYFLRTYIFDQDYSEKSILNFVNLFNTINPAVLRSYPDPLFFIAQKVNEKGIKLNPVRSINTTGNTLFPEVRNLVEEAFGTRIFDSYSCEGSAVAYECPTHNQYHLSMEYGISEVLNQTGEEVNEQESGKHIVTDLQNLAFPFIRYDSKDIVVKGNKCSCGREHDTLKQVLGRDNDILITPAGQFLIAQNFTTFFKHRKEILYFQVVQNKTDQININVVVNDKIFNDSKKSEIIDHWKDYCSNSMTFQVNIVDEIPLLPSGKRRFLLRDKHIALNL